MIEYQEKEHTMQNMPIAIFRGDDTDALGYQTIVGTIKTDLDLTGCKAVFKYLSFSVEFNPIPADKKLTVIIPASETKKFPPGLGYASLRVYDAEGKLCTFSNRIMVFVATKTPMFGNAEFEVDFNVRPELEPLKIFVGPNPDDFDEYRGFLEKVIDRASAQKYGLSILLDAIDSDLGADDGVAATPTAVKAAYDAIVGKLTDDYYTKGETDEAIDRVAAYYITYDAAGNPFPTYAALANAQTVYSGGTVRVPTRNDYCVVLADETHDNAEYRYIYAVAEGQTTGSWQPQFPVEGVMTIDQSVTKDSQNPVNGGGVWSAIWGALTALPTGFSSLYDWCAAQLAGKADDADVTLTAKWTLAFSLTAAQKEAFSQTPGASDNNYALTIAPSPGGGTYRLYVGSYDAAILIRYPSESTNLILMTGDSRLGLQPDDLVATLSGYTLGSQSDKPLASEAEAEALRNGKLDKSGGTMTGNLTAYTEEGAYAEIKAETKEGSIAIRQTGRVSTLETDDYTFVLPDHDGIIALDRDLKTKLNASSAAPAFSSDSSVSYPVGSHVTYNGKLYKCTTATTGGTWVAASWEADVMTDPDAVLDITAQNQLRVVAKDGTLLWAQGYDLASTSSATLACDACNNFTFADGATTQAFTLPTAPTGKVGDFGLDIDNSANTGAATMTLTGLDTAFSVVIPEGESLNDMLSIAAGELARFYFTLSTFRINNLPTWHIVKQVVENGGAQS